MALSHRVGRTFFGRLQSQIFSRNIIKLGYPKEEPNNFGLRTPSAKTFDYCSSVILRTRFYLLGHFKVIHVY